MADDIDMLNDTIDLPPAVPAATLVIFDDHVRDPANGAPQLLMVRRAQAMVFAGGAVVFPGGRVDPDDYVLAATLAGDGASREHHDDLAARVAAIRETLEETGLAVGVDVAPDRMSDVAAALRAGLAREEPFSMLLAESGASLDLAQLTLFARWCPAMRHARRFDTRFYIANATRATTLGLTVDERENSALFWSSAANTLRLADSGDLEVIFPTRRNLERLAQYSDFAVARDVALTIPETTIVPWFDVADGQRLLRIPAGLDYPVTSEPVTSAMRG